MNKIIDESWEVIIKEEYKKDCGEYEYKEESELSNPDLWKIMEYCRANNVVPNITINGDRLTDEIVNNLVKHCGAVAVSAYDLDTCYNTVKRLTDAGLKYCNIHALLAEESYDKCFKIIDDSVSDSRLSKLGAVVFLFLKPKGDRNVFHKVSSKEKYKKLVDYAFEKKARIGFDSCSASSFLEAIKDRPDYKRIETMVEPCESTLFSGYCNVEGIFFPCSFTEGEKDYKGIDLKVIKSFDEVWHGDETKTFRNKVLTNKDCRGCRKCQAFNLEIGE